MAGELNLLPGVSVDYVRERLSVARGKEIESGKFVSSDSSAALAVNAFAWFHQKPELLPVLPGCEGAGWPATHIDIEYCARFPWTGGQHPWLDALVSTHTHIIGVESKRHEPFRDAKNFDLSEAYDRLVWGQGMKPFEAMRDTLRKDGRSLFKHVDAAQLVKHAFGLVTETRRVRGKPAMLVYLYAEPSVWPAEAIIRHRLEVEQFSRAVKGAAVNFVAARWHDWLKGWTLGSDDAVRVHGERLRERFDVGTLVDD